LFSPCARDLWAAQARLEMGQLMSWADISQYCFSVLRFSSTDLCNVLGNAYFR
jgi:hypothetical protein